MIINLVIIITVLVSHLLACFIISKMFKNRNKKAIYPVLIYTIGYLILATFVILLIFLFFGIELIIFLIYFYFTFEKGEGQENIDFTLKQKIKKGMNKIHDILPLSSIKKYAIIFGIAHIVIIIITYYVYGRYSKLYLKGTRKLENDGENVGDYTKEYNFDLDQDTPKFTMSLISTSSMIYVQSTLFNGVFIAAIILSYLNTFT